MKSSSARCSNSWRRPGLTLIEVISGIVLLSTLLVAAMLAYSQHIRQMDQAHRRLEAIKAADRLLSDWSARSAMIPVGAEGALPGTEHLAWRTSAVHNSAAERLGATVVRLDVWAANGFPAKPLVQVELLQRRQNRSSDARTSRAR